MGDERQTSKQRRLNAQIQHPELTRHREETGSPAGANRKGRGRRPRRRDARDQGPARGARPEPSAPGLAPGCDLAQLPCSPAEATRTQVRRGGSVLVAGGEGTPATRGAESWGARWAAGLGGAGAGAGAAWLRAGGRQEAGLIL